jgi:hypothetical protein
VIDAFPRSGQEIRKRAIVRSPAWKTAVDKCRLWTDLESRSGRAERSAAVADQRIGL